MIASGWRTAPPQVLIMRLFWSQTPHACYRQKLPLVFPISTVSPYPRSFRRVRTAELFLHLAPGIVHAASASPHPVRTHGEPHLALAPGQLAIVLCLVCRSHLNQVGQKEQSNVERNLYLQYSA